MKIFQDLECYINGLNYYYDDIITTEGVRDSAEFELLSEFKARLDDFSREHTWSRYERLNKAYESFYVDGILHKRFRRYDLRKKFDCLSELMMRLKRILDRDKVE